MVSKKKYILTVITSIIVTAFLVLTIGNVLYVEVGNKVIVSQEAFGQYKHMADKYSKQESLMNLAEKNFLYEADESVMMEGALKGMMSALGDPYTEFLTKSEFNSIMEDTSGSYDGLGIYITPSEDKKIMIVSPIEDTPAEKAGLKPGDIIAKINGTEYTYAEVDEAIKVMKGKPGTEVSLTILRQNNDNTETIEMNIERQKIKLKTVKPYMLKDDIGYIRVTTFDQPTSADFDAAYASLKKQGAKSLIIDLRSNPGGLMDSSVEIADKFLDEGVITYTRTKNGEIEYSNSNDSKENLPLVLLVNGGSASASEILSGAIKDRGAGTLVGTKTYGKGIVQRVQPFGNEGEGVKITISQYFTPNGINIHGIGIEPDVVIELDPNAKGYGPDFYDTDNQLQKAVEVIKQKMNK